MSRRWKEKTPFLLAEPDSGRAICLNQLGVEKIGKRGQQAP